MIPQHAIDSDWCKARQKGIGGSDVAAIMGVSKFKTPLQVYLEKRGEAPPLEDNWRMMTGRTMEPVIRQFYADTTGQAVHVPQEIIVSEKHPFMLANLDGYTDEPKVVEIKWTGNGREWGEEGTDQIPQQYMCQVQHYMIVTGFPCADVVAAINNSEPKIYTVEADPELQEMMIEAEAEFWDRVQKGIPPEPVTYAEAVQKYGRLAVSGTVEIGAGNCEDIRHLKKIRSQIARLEKEEEELKAEFIKLLGEKGDTLVYQGQPLITYKLAAGRKAFDSKAFEKTHPDLYQQFTKTGEPSRRFLIK